jgi:hypothetical protein
MATTSTPTTAPDRPAPTTPKPCPCRAAAAVRASGCETSCAQVQARSKPKVERGFTSDSNLGRWVVSRVLRSDAASRVACWCRSAWGSVFPPVGETASPLLPGWGFLPPPDCKEHLPEERGNGVGPIIEELTARAGGVRFAAWRGRFGSSTRGRFTTGGDHQEAVYRDDADRELFLRCLEEAGEKTGWLIQVISTYIHLNPVRAGLIRSECGRRVSRTVCLSRWATCWVKGRRRRFRARRCGLGRSRRPGNGCRRLCGCWDGMRPNWRPSRRGQRQSWSWPGGCVCVGTRPPRAVGSLSV